MITRLLIPLFLFSFVPLDLLAQESEYDRAVKSYIRDFSDVAVREMVEYRIPASITLAQGIIETNAGRSRLAREANNHFGIKCHREWVGMRFIQDDEEKNECFRKYQDAIQSYRDHSLFLTTRDRYKPLFALDIQDYKGWALGLRQSGYATNPAYAELLIKTIEKYGLQRYDTMSFVPVTPGKPQQVAEYLPPESFRKLGETGGGRPLFVNNGVRLVIAYSDDHIYLISKEVGVSVKRLLKYNDLERATDMKPGQPVYLEPKRRKADTRFYETKGEEELLTIAQRYGVKLKYLARRNDLPGNVTLPAGRMLKLR